MGSTIKTYGVRNLNSQNGQNLDVLKMGFP